MHLKILHSVHIPFLPIQVQEPSRCVLNCQMCHSWLIWSPTMEKKKRQQYYHYSKNVLKGRHRRLERKICDHMVPGSWCSTLTARPAPPSLGYNSRISKISRRHPTICGHLSHRIAVLSQTFFFLPSKQFTCEIS